MIPGEIIVANAPDLETNVGLEVKRAEVANTGDRPIQVGSHFHFYEVNRALRFDREASRGFRLNIPAGTAVRFEPGDTREVEQERLRREIGVEYDSYRRIYLADGHEWSIVGQIAREDGKKYYILECVG